MGELCSLDPLPLTVVSSFLNLFAEHLTDKGELERHHDLACEKNTALTNALTTPDGIDVQIYGRMVKRGKRILPEFSIVKIIQEQ